MQAERDSREQEAFRAILRQLRRQSKFTQAGLAELLGRPQSFVSKYESGERRLDVLELRSVCRALGLHVGELLSLLDVELEKLQRETDSGIQPKE